MSAGTTVLPKTPEYKKPRKLTAGVAYDKAAREAGEELEAKQTSVKVRRGSRERVRRVGRERFIIVCRGLMTGGEGGEGGGELLLLLFNDNDNDDDDDDDDDDAKRGVFSFTNVFIYGGIDIVVDIIVIVFEGIIING